MAEKDSDKPELCNVIVLGMAGSGKTSLLKRLCCELSLKGMEPYVINLDPAVHEVPYPANIDIRDTVDFKEVLQLLDRRKFTSRYTLIDTPGQIEVFTWSASGAIITESLSSSHPTVVLYVMDVARSTNPTTFMSNMLYACGILYKTRLPLVIALNKTDVTDPAYAHDWMSDFEKFQSALETDTTYASNLSRSLSLVLDEFYSTLKAVGVSAHTGSGVDELIAAIDEAHNEYNRDYRPYLDERRKERERSEQTAAAAAEKQRDKVPLRERLARQIAPSMFAAQRHGAAYLDPRYDNDDNGDDNDDTEMETRNPDNVSSEHQLGAAAEDDASEDENERREYVKFRHFLAEQGIKPLDDESTSAIGLEKNLATLSVAEKNT